MIVAGFEGPPTARGAMDHVFRLIYLNKLARARDLAMLLYPHPSLDSYYAAYAQGIAHAIDHQLHARHLRWTTRRSKAVAS